MKPDDKRGTPKQPNSPATDPQQHSFVPSVDKVADYLLFGLSLPERALRSSSAAVSGAVRESAALLLPQAFRSSKSYSTFVQQMLDFMAHDVGGVDRDGQGKSDQDVPVEQYVARKTVGGFIDLAAIPLLHVSPMTVLAIVSDIAYGSQTYLNELSEELKTLGVIDQATTIDHAADLLEALNQTTSAATDAMDTPPLSIAGLAETIRQVTEASAGADLAKTIPQGEIDRLWIEMHQIAVKENQTVFEISSAMSMFAMNRIGKLGRGALSTITVAGNMFDLHIIDHYRIGLEEINEKGFYTLLADSSKPYISAMWQNFSSDRETITEDVFSGRLVGRTWNTVSQWFKSTGDKPAHGGDS